MNAYQSLSVIRGRAIRSLASFGGSATPFFRADTDDDVKHHQEYDRDSGQRIHLHVVANHHHCGDERENKIDAARNQQDCLQWFVVMENPSKDSDHEVRKGNVKQEQIHNDGEHCSYLRDFLIAVRGPLPDAFDTQSQASGNGPLEESK